MSFLLSKASEIARSPGHPKVIETGPSSLKSADRVGRALGWASFGLGAVELLAPRAVTTWLGMEGREGLIRAYGAREVAAGVLCLSTNNDVGAWARAGGDVIDLATLASAYRDDNPRKRNVGIAIAAVVGIAIADAATGWSIRSLHKRKGPVRDYSDRSGFPKGVDFSRGRAAGQIPADYRAAPGAAEASPVTGEATPVAAAIEQREPEPAA
ncbi:MAG: hypothetical protein ACJ8FT_08480 [Sphingomonas sp.]